MMLVSFVDHVRSLFSLDSSSSSGTVDVDKDRADIVATLSVHLRYGIADSAATAYARSCL